MKMSRRITMKKIVLILLLMVILMTLSACNEVVDTTTETVRVTVEDAEFKEGETHYHIINGIMTPVVDLDTYKIVVSYKGRQYKFDGKEVYNKYFEMVGKEVEANLVTDTYEDGTVVSYIDSLK